MRIWFLFKEKYGLYSICYYYICENEKNVVTLQNLFKNDYLNVGVIFYEMSKKRSIKR